MVISSMCTFNNNIELYKSQISFIDAVSHVSSTVINMTKCVVSDSYGRRKIAYLVLLLSRTVTKRVVFVFLYYLRGIMQI